MDELTEQIAPGLRQGDREAWARLYEAFAERLWREVSRLMGGAASDVADVVQEVFLAAAKSARQFDPARGTLWMWLTGIARRQAALRFRRRSSELELARRWWASLDGKAGSWLAGSGDAPDEALAAKEMASLVRAALLEMPAHYGDLLTRRYLDGLTAGEIARQTGSTAEAVRAKLARGRRAFRETFLKLVRHDSSDLWKRRHEER